MKPNITRSPVHPPSPRQHSWAQAPLRFTWFDPKLKRPLTQEEETRRRLTQEEETRRRLARLDAQAAVGFIVFIACLAAACVVAALGFRGLLP